jgi:hypothetical protein
MVEVIGYEFREGSRFQRGSPADANLVGGHLDALRVEFKGELTPADVVAAARSANSPLHPFFEWDDRRAGEQHRLAQARGLIRAVVAVYRTADAERPVRRVVAFTHIPHGAESHYRATHEALGLTATRRQVLGRAWEELQRWRRRYRDLEEFSELFEAIDRRTPPAVE